MALLFNRVGHTTATTGTGTLTLGGAIDNSYATFVESGAVSTNVLTYVISEGNDFEIGRGTFTSTSTLTRDTVLLSKIGGTAGTTKMTLAGAAQVRCTLAKEDISSLILGAPGTSSSITFSNATSGSIVLAPTGGALGSQLIALPASSGTLYISGGTDVALADGGTGASLADPNIDEIMMWDDSAGTMKLAALADINTESAPIAGDFVLMYDSAGNLLKTDWSNITANVTVANEATDTTCFPLFVTAATGALGPKTNANLAYNSNTGQLNITGPTGISSGSAAVVVTGGIGFSQGLYGLNGSAQQVARFDGTGNTGTTGLLVTATQNAQNTGDTGDSAMSLAWTINAASASNELIGRIFNFSTTNNLTGGGQVQNLRCMDMTCNTGTGAVTGSASYIYMSTTGAGTLNFFNGLHVTSSITAGAVHGITDDCLASVWQHAGTTASSNTTSGAFTVVGGVGIGGMINVGGGSNIGKTTATTNAVQYAERLQIDCSGTPAIGLGVGMDFNIEVTAGVFKAGAAVQASSYNITSGQETFTLDCRAMASNALGEPEGLSFLHRSYTADTAYTNNNTVQQWFLSTGAVAVEGATSYEFEGLLLQTPGTTSHTVGLSFAGSATLTSISYLAEQSPVVVGTTLANTSNVTQVNVATNVVVTPAITTAGTAIWIRGIVRINAAGTFIPSFTFSAAPGAGNNLKGTFFKMRKIGSNTNASQGRWT